MNKNSKIEEEQDSEFKIELANMVNYVGKNVKMGKNVKIWHFSYVGDNTVIGDDVMIGSLCHVDYNVRIGNRVRIEGLTYIPPLTIIGDNVFIGPAVVFTNDPYPPSKKMAGVVVEEGAVIGARAVIKAGVKIGRGSVIAMGAIVTRDVPAYTVVMGTPADAVYDRVTYEKKRRKWEESLSS